MIKTSFMRKPACIFYLVYLFCNCAQAQTEVHSTMFMFNKLLFNPAYTGSREIVSARAGYRSQWSAIKGAPKSYCFSADAPLGSKFREFREAAIGLSFSNEQIGVERKQNIFGYYAYRIQMKNEAILSMGISGGAQMYSANYSELDPYHANDPNLARDVKASMLPNCGAGIFYYNTDYYFGFAVPNILQNYYDNTEKINGNKAQQVRGYYASGGYVFHVNDACDVLPQVMARYQSNGRYQVPFNMDINISAIARQRILFGLTYRTDRSIETILQLQATRTINIGYAYDYVMSTLNEYNGGAHELTVGFDMRRREDRYEPARFAKLF
ncbi:MAG: hypothetical protein K0Q79_3305 [Flavipsychrobacter sp.]|jgi:type IX secretion system PorP/SprF family membrane protein|nr:hypothetical protein [Flavipsychrobacter sp.]